MNIVAAVVLTMRNAASLIGAVSFAAGFAWQFGSLLLEWIGRAIGIRGVSGSYEAFVADSIGKLMAEGSLIGILGSWILMGAGLILIASVRLQARQHDEWRPHSYDR